jgi:hypothetical protein
MRFSRLFRGSLCAFHEPDELRSRANADAALCTLLWHEEAVSRTIHHRARSSGPSSSTTNCIARSFSGFGPGTWVSNGPTTTLTLGADDIGDTRCDDAVCHGKKRDLSRSAAGLSRPAETATNRSARSASGSGSVDRRATGGLLGRLTDQLIGLDALADGCWRVCFGPSHCAS